MLSLLMLALPLAAAITDESYVPQYALDGSYDSDGSYIAQQYSLDGSYARDGNSVDGSYARDGNFNMILENKESIVSKVGNFIYGHIVQEIMVVSVAFLLAHLFGFNLFPGLTTAMNELGGSVKQSLFNIVGRQARSLDPDTINTMAMVVDRAIQTYEQMQ